MYRRFAVMIAVVVALLAGPLAAQDAAAPAGPTAADTDAAIDQLLVILRDDAARAALIARLEAEGPAGGADAAPGAPNVAQGIAEAAADFAAAAARDLSRFVRDFARLRLLARQIGAEGAELWPEIRALLLTIASTLAAAALSGAVARRIARRLAVAPVAGIGPRLRATGLAALAHVAALAVAWAAGYALATFVFAAAGAPSAAQTLYLNAFAAFGLVRVVLRLLASPDADREPSLSVIAPGAQTVIYRNLRMVAGIAIQGFMFIVPLFGLWFGFVGATPMRALVATVAAAAALVAIRRIARTLDRARGDRAQPSRTLGEAGAAVAKSVASAWRQVWPPLALVFVAYCWIAVVTRPSQAAAIVLTGTAYSIAAVLALLAALWLVGRAAALKAPLPRLVVGLLPRLGPRADLIAAVLGWAGALVLALTALALAFHGWGWLDIGSLLAQENVQTVLWRIVSAALVALLAAMLWAVIASWIDQRLQAELPGRNVSARSRTLLALFRNAFTIIIGVLATMITLSQLGVDIAPLLAGAGVIGLAVGFGSQKLVQDIITGVFIQLENAMNEGDVVGVAGITGGVEKITIRSVRLRTLDGAVHVIPFSSVDTVTNLTRDFSFHVAEIGVAYKEKVIDVKAAMEEAFERLKTEGFEGDILEPLEMQGVIMLGDSAVTVRARIKTLPGKQWGIGRRYTELVKEVMDERGIEIPFPHRQIVLPESFALPPPAPSAEPPDRTGRKRE